MLTPNKLICAYASDMAHPVLSHDHVLIGPYYVIVTWNQALIISQQPFVTLLVQTILCPLHYI